MFIPCDNISPSHFPTEGIPCPDVPFVRNAKQRYEESRDGVYISLICNYAHQFPDGSTVKRIQCNMADGEWSETPPDCEGEKTSWHKLNISAVLLDKSNVFGLS